MKKLLFALFLIAGGATISSSANAQVSININIGNQPAWGPTGYDYVQYYYLPDINAYYDVARAQYIYLNRKRWVYARQLPTRYRNYNIYNSYKVVVNRANPYRNNAMDFRAYGKYKGVHNQPMIRDAHEQKYFINKGNRYHDQYNNKRQNKRNDWDNHNNRNNRGR